MVRTSLLFAIVGVAAFIGSDISLSTLDPGLELKRMALGLATPDFFSLPGLGVALFNTISFALIGLFVAVLAGSILAFFFEHTPVRLFCAFIRAIHELFWAFLFMPIVGLNSTCGILAIAVPYAGVFAKVYAEIRQEADQQPGQALAPGPLGISAFFYTTLPVIYLDIKNYTSYRFECALRSSAILGFIGLPTLGYHLETSFREGLYSEAAALLYLFYLLIISLKYWARAKYIVIPLLIAVTFTNWQSSFSWDNISRFFMYDILPWPMRADGFYLGTGEVHFSFTDVAGWLWAVVYEQGIPGTWNTFVLTQIALVFTAVFTLLSFPLASRQFFKPFITRVARVLLVVLRTTPEYILAYILLQLWGPSMLPAICALTMHNGAILAHLTALNVNLMQLPFDKPRSRMNRYLFEVLPRCYGQFMAFLFYRWEVIMRESAILGILGITTLGFYIDSAMSQDHLDNAVVLIIITALLNMLIDTISQRIRKSLKISAHVGAKCSG